LDHVHDDLRIVDVEQQVEGDPSAGERLADHEEVVVERSDDTRAKLRPLVHEPAEAGDHALALLVGVDLVPSPAHRAEQDHTPRLLACCVGHPVIAHQKICSRIFKGLCSRSGL
jgi:hypothetical protein